jgi:hypothetical protein
MAYSPHEQSEYTTYLNIHLCSKAQLNVTFNFQYIKYSLRKAQGVSTLQKRAIALF